MTDQPSRVPTWGITTPPTQQWHSQAWTWSESQGWGDNVAWTGQGDGYQTWTGRAKSMIDTDMKEKKAPAANAKDNKTEYWQNYVQSDWDEAHDAWENPARGNGPTPGASSSSSDLAWGHDRGHLRRISGGPRWP